MTRLYLASLLSSMLLLLFLLSTSAGCARAQYLLKRMPARSSPMDALQHLRMPPQRYFRQMESEAEPGYQLYALPPQWTNEAVAEFPSDYEYEGDLYEAPAYPDYVPQQEAVDPESSVYNDLMAKYLMGVPEQAQLPEEDLSMKRRSQGTLSSPRDTEATMPPTNTPQNQAQVTAVPTTPEKKAPQSAGSPVPRTPGGGQKEEPLFRPSQSSQRTVWEDRQSSLLKKVKNAQKADPLAEELSNLKGKQ